MLTLSQKIIGLIAIGLVVYSLFVLQTQEDLIESTLFDQVKKQVLVFLDGLEREITLLPDPLNPAALQKLVQRSLPHKEDLEFSIHRLYIYDRDGNILADTSGKKKRK